MDVIILLIGLLVGGLSVYFIYRTKINAIELRLKSLIDSEKTALSTNLLNKEETINILSSQLDKAVDEGKLLQQNNSELGEKVSALEQKLDGERKLSQEKLKLLEDAQRVLANEFEALSSKALKSNTESFLEIAKDKLQSFQKEAKDDLESRQKAIDDLVKPLKDSLTNYDKKISEIETKRVSAYDVIKDQIKNLQQGSQKLEDETVKLIQALRKPTVRGRWGEIQLRNVVEMAGMVEYCDFNEQLSITDGESLQRPDLVVKLPNEKIIVVDSKTPLEHYLESLEMPDDNRRLQYLKEHANSVKNHIMQLSQKAYWKQFEQTPEFVVLFLPGEMFFSAALQQDPSLIEFGVDNKIIVATPTTLIALLRAVAYGWKQDKIAKNAREISDLGKELYERIRVFSSHISKVGKGISNSVEAYNKAVGSLEGRVLITARKFNELGAGTSKEINGLSVIETNVRSLQAPEAEERK